MNKSYLIKRSLVMLLVAWITFMSVFQAYQKTTQCAEWVAGTIATIGASPMLTALLVGGVVVAGGVAIYKIATTDAEDYRNFATGIKQGFQEFVADREKQIALEQDSTLSDQQAADIGVANARETVNNFFDNAITTTKNTVKNLTVSAWEYWDLYSRIIGNVADNGIPDDAIVPTPLDPVKVPSSPALGVNMGMTNSNNRFVEFNDHYYIIEGEYLSGNFVRGAISSAAIILPFAYVFDYNDGLYYLEARLNLWLDSSGNLNNISISQSGSHICNRTELATFTVPVIYGVTEEEIKSNYVDWFSVGGNNEDVKTWERTVDNTLKNTKFGDAIRTGRKQLVNEGDWVGSIFKDNSVPVKKTGVNVNEGVVSAPVGWDIPAGSIWDDVFSGGKPYADVVGQTGAIGVPDDVITGTKQGDTVIEYPDTADVQDTADYPRDTTDNPPFEDSKPQEIPDKPQQEIIEDQGGIFYPSTMDLTNIFPFCIPFDIIYLVDKFDIQGERAPVITIPIVYPNAIRSAMGSDSYVVTIDFEDFIVVRNVIRVFLLILFIVGLLKITRDLIRG